MQYQIALIETEGQMAIDVFYLTSGRAKLSQDQQAALGRSLQEELASTSMVEQGSTQKR